MVNVREKIFGSITDDIRRSIASSERWLFESQETIIKGKAKLAELEASIATLTPDEIVNRLKKPEYERMYAILSKLVKNVGHVDELSQFISLDLNAAGIDAYYDKLINSDKFFLGISIVTELSKFLLGVDDFKDVKSEGQQSCIDDFFFEDVTKFIKKEIDIKRPYPAEDIAKFIIYIKDGVVTDIDEEWDDYFYVFYICNNSFFWLLYDALLRDEKAVEEGCKLFKRIKMEMALEGKPVKFEEE